MAPRDSNRKENKKARKKSNKRKSIRKAIKRLSDYGWTIPFSTYYYDSTEEVYQSAYKTDSTGEAHFYYEFGKLSDYARQEINRRRERTRKERAATSESLPRKAEALYNRVMDYLENFTPTATTPLGQAKQENNVMKLLSELPAIYDSIGPEQFYDNCVGSAGSEEAFIKAVEKAVEDYDMNKTTYEVRNNFYLDTVLSWANSGVLSVTDYDESITPLGTPYEGEAYGEEE